MLILTICLLEAMLIIIIYQYDRKNIVFKSGIDFKKIIFITYIIAICYVTILSRVPEESSFIILRPFGALRTAVYIDIGIFEVFRVIFHEGMAQGLEHIHVWNTEPLESIVLNILLFVPFGYIVPSMWPKICNKAWKGLLLGCGASLLIEITQLITYRGWFDVDDLINNTLGALVGYVLFRKLNGHVKEE